MRKDSNFYHRQVPGDYYHQAVRKNFLQHFWHLRRFKEVKNFLNDIKAKKILDIGCHGGRFTFEISQKFSGSSIDGIDISPVAINFAKKKYPTIHFQVARAEKLPFPTNRFDLVTCLEVLEHVKDPVKVLKEIKRVLKKEGNFIVLIPTMNLLFRLIWFTWVHLGPGRVWRHTHVQKFENDSLDNLLEQAGFKIIKRKLFLSGMLLLIQAKRVKQEKLVESKRQL